MMTVRNMERRPQERVSLCSFMFHAVRRRRNSSASVMRVKTTSAKVFPLPPFPKRPFKISRESKSFLMRSLKMLKETDSAADSWTRSFYYLCYWTNSHDRRFKYVSLIQQRNSNSRRTKTNRRKQIHELYFNATSWCPLQTDGNTKRTFDSKKQ